MKKLLLSALLAMLCAGAVWGANSRDVNGDGEVNISDVNAVIDAILSGQAVASADVNGDGEVNISDINSVIDYILGGLITESFTVNGVKFTMVEVRGGTFMMGATEEQADAAFSEEYPVHQVTLSTFYMGNTEVTQALWLAVMGENPSYFTGDLRRPVERVSWNDCQEFIAKLNELTGRTFRLPTEAEWEFAARGGNKSHGYKYSGSDNLDEVAWYWYSLPAQQWDAPGCCTQPVGTKKPNELGLYDMSGNVYERCQDLYDNYSSEPQTDPTGPKTGWMRVYRGGCWNSMPIGCRVSCRDGVDPDHKPEVTGLRLAL